MALTDPQSVTINAVAQSMPRTSVGSNTSTYTQDDQTNQLIVSHQYGKRVRRSIRLNDSKIAANPFDTTRNEQISMSVYLVIDVPPQGYTIVEQQDVVDGLVAYLAASSGAIVTQVLGGEN